MINNTSDADTISLQNKSTQGQNIYYSNDCSKNKDEEDSVVVEKICDLKEISSELESFKNNAIAINEVNFRNKIFIQIFNLNMYV